MGTTNDLVYIIKARNESRGAAKAFTKDMKAAGTSTKKITAEAKKARAETRGLGVEAKKASASIKGASVASAGLGKGMKLAAASLGLLAAGFLSLQGIGSALGNAREFNAAIAETSTLIEGTPAEIAELTASAKELSAVYGSSSTGQVEAFYQAISAGVGDVADATELLDVANKLAIGGVTDVTTAVDILTTVTNAYGTDVISAAEASDTLFVAMKAGKTTIGELARSLGQVIPIAVAAGVSFDELAAATAALTTQGLKTSVATTGLKAIFAGIIKPTKEAGEEATRLGLDFSLAALEAKGFAGFMNDLTIATGGSAGSITQLFGSVEAAAAVLSFTGGAGDKFVATMTDMGDKAGQAQEAFEKISALFDQRLKVAIQQLIEIGTRLGSVLLSVLVPAMETLAFITRLLTDNSDALIIAFTILAVSRIPALITNLRTLSISMEFAAFQFGAGAIASRALTVAMNAIPFVAVVTLVTATFRGLSRASEAAKGFAESMKGVASAQVLVNSALEEFNIERGARTLDTLKQATELSISQIEDAIKSATEDLEAASFKSNLFGFSLFDTKEMSKARAALKDLGGALATAQARMSAWEAINLDAEKSVRKAIPTIKELAQAQSAVGKTAQQAVPSLNDLREQYGDLAGTVRENIELQNELARVSAAIAFDNTLSDVSKLADTLALTKAELFEMNSQLVFIKNSDSFTTQANAAADMARQIVEANGGAENLDATTREIVEKLLEASGQAAKLSDEEQKAAINAAKIATSVSGISFVNAIAGANGLTGALGQALGKANATLKAIGAAALSDRSTVDQLAITNVRLSGAQAGKSSGEIAGDVAATQRRQEFANTPGLGSDFITTAAIEASVAEARKLAVELDGANTALTTLNSTAGGGGGGGGGTSALADAVKRMSDNYTLLTGEVGLSGIALEDYRIKQELLTAAQQDGIELSDEIVAGILAQRDALLAAQAVGGTFIEGMKAGYAEFAASVQTNMEFAQSITVNAFQGMSGIISDFVTTGKADFKGLLIDLLSQISQFLANKLLIDFLGIGGGQGAGGGGTVGFLKSLAGSIFKDNGGQVVAGRPYIVGERRPEVFIPNSSGKIAAAHGGLPTGGGGGGNTFNVNFSFPNSDADSFKRSEGQVRARMARVMADADRRNN